MAMNPSPEQSKVTPVLGIPPATKRQRSLLVEILLALGYILLIPVVTFSSLLALTTYFPDKTREALGPLLARIMPTNEETSLEERVSSLLGERLTSIEERLDKVEKGFNEHLEAISSAAPTSGAPAQGGPVSGAGPSALSQEAKDELGKIIKEMEERSRLLGALSAVTAARIEYSQGNLQKCQKELTSAKTLLDKAHLVSDESKNLLQKAIEEIGRGSIQAEDWLSLTWHSLYEELGKDSNLK